MRDDMTDVMIALDDVQLPGMLEIPDDAKGIVVFAHGSGSSRLSPRNNFVAKQLRTAGFATLLFDLLTEEEDTIRETRFDIELLTKRLLAVTKWLATQDVSLSIGYFGASTGAAAALDAAATLGNQIKAVVSRGGRPDMAKNLDKVRSPTLLIVGGDDTPVIGMNEEAKSKMTCTCELTIIEGATHLFEESGKLEEAAKLAITWFTKYLV